MVLQVVSFENCETLSVFAGNFCVGRQRSAFPFGNKIENLLVGSGGFGILSTGKTGRLPLHRPAPAKFPSYKRKASSGSEGSYQVMQLGVQIFSVLKSGDRSKGQIHAAVKIIYF